jgi:hypothetical protein
MQARADKLRDVPPLSGLNLTHFHFRISLVMIVVFLLVIRFAFRISTFAFPPHYPLFNVIPINFIILHPHCRICLILPLPGIFFGRVFILAGSL